MTLSSQSRNPLRIAVQRLLVCVLIVLAWQGMVKFKIWDETIVPSPVDVVVALWSFRGILSSDMLSTTKLIAAGFAITVFFAFFIAVFLHLLPKVRQIVYWLFVLLQCVPLFAIAPILLYWTGRDRTFLSQLITVVLAAFFPVLVTTAHGLQEVDRGLLDLFDSMNASSWQKLWHLEIPNAMQVVTAGSKITLTMCVIGAVLAEMLVGEMSGLGFRMKEANAHMNVAEVFAGLFVLAGVSVSLFWLLGIIAHHLQPWIPREGTE